MKRTQQITLAILTVLLTAWNAQAHGPQGATGSFGTRHLAMMQTVLDLTDKQTATVKEIFNNGRQDISKLVKQHNFKRSDMGVMRAVTGKFRQDAFAQLETLLSKEQLRTLRKEIIEQAPMEFILLSKEEKQIRLQDVLELNEEEADQVATVFEQEKAKHEAVLTNLGFSPEQMLAFRQDMLTQREEIKRELGEILSVEQMEQFEEISSRMKNQKGRSPFRPFTTESE